MIYFALTLLLHNTLPLQMVNNILSVSFLEKLDDEVESCFAKVNSIDFLKIFYKYILTIILISFLIGVLST